MSAYIISKSRTRDYIMARAPGLRHHKFERISRDSFDYLDMKYKELCDELVFSQPSKGKTIMSPLRGRDT